MAGIKRVGIIFIILCSTLSAQADEYTAQQLLRRIYAYAASVPPMSDDTLETYAYMRYSLHVQKRNWTLMAVPTMYALAHGNNGNMWARACSGSAAGVVRCLPPTNCSVSGTFPITGRCFPA